ncbi:MAG: hypothetical protein QOJ07_2980 [Thermoleophilaceae bacterium]|jgi:hypothetical protein|nr:hypothetical protein [Thermoleophilaceae bacterium]
MRSVADYERDFRRAGLPFFIEDYSATGDVFTRAAWLLTLVFVVEMFGAIELDWSFLANAGAALGGLALLVLAWGVANRVRGRPFWSLPRSVDRVELALFVVVPALLPLVFNGQWRSALGTAAGNLLLLAAIYGVVGYGLVSIVRWVAVRLVGELGASAVRLARAVPLILGGAVLLFLTTELWQVFADIPLAFLLVLAGFFAVIGTSFIAARLPAEVRRLEESAPGGPPLTPRQRVNVGLVLFVSQAIQVLLVAAGVGAFFVVLGTFAVSADVRRSWLGSPGNVLIDLPLLGERVQVTAELLRVAGGLAALSGLSYAVQMQTDETYRRLFLDEVTGEMRASFRERADYLRARYS